MIHHPFLLYGVMFNSTPEAPGSVLESCTQHVDIHKYLAHSGDAKERAQPFVLRIALATVFEVLAIEAGGKQPIAESSFETKYPCASPLQFGCDNLWKFA